MPNRPSQGKSHIYLHSGFQTLLWTEVVCGWLMVEMLPFCAWWSNWCPFLVGLHKQQGQWAVVVMLYEVSNSYLFIYPRSGSQLSWPQAISVCGLQYSPRHTHTHNQTYTQADPHIQTPAIVVQTVHVIRLFPLWFCPRLITQLSAGSLSQSSVEL